MADNPPRLSALDAFADEDQVSARLAAEQAEREREQAELARRNLEFQQRWNKAWGELDEALAPLLAGGEADADAVARALCSVRGAVAAHDRQSGQSGDVPPALGTRTLAERLGRVEVRGFDSPCPRWAARLVRIAVEAAADHSSVERLAVQVRVMLADEAKRRAFGWLHFVGKGLAFWEWDILPPNAVEPDPKGGPWRPVSHLYNHEHDHDAGRLFRTLRGEWYGREFGSGISAGAESDERPASEPAGDGQTVDAHKSATTAANRGAVSSPCPADATEILARIAETSPAKDIARLLGYPDKGKALGNLLCRYQRDKNKKAGKRMPERGQTQAEWVFFASEIVGKLVEWLKRLESKVRTD